MLMNPDFDALIQSEMPVVVDFRKTDCEPCSLLDPVLEQVKHVLEKRIEVVRVDADANPELALQYRISYFPSLLLFQDGRLLWRQTGLMGKEEIIARILEHIS